MSFTSGTEKPIAPAIDNPTPMIPKDISVLTVKPSKLPMPVTKYTKPRHVDGCSISTTN